MKAKLYGNTNTNCPTWRTEVHKDCPLGYAYVKDKYFIHIWGVDKDLYDFSLNITTTEGGVGDIETWAVNNFGAVNIVDSYNEVGEVVEGIWRPGLYYWKQAIQALKINEEEHRPSCQALRILIDKLDDILLYVEPGGSGLDTYSHKIRELLILACTEVENYWIRFLKLAGESASGSGFTTRDYCKLLDPLYLSEYEIKIQIISSMPASRPFDGWDTTRPTQSLSWYNAYNKTKHDRDSNFSEAKLRHCIDAIAATIVLYCVRYSPYYLTDARTSLSAIFNHYFHVGLVSPDPRTFYIPNIQIPAGFTKQVNVLQVGERVEPWITNTLVL